MTSALPLRSVRRACAALALLALPGTRHLSAQSAPAPSAPPAEETVKMETFVVEAIAEGQAKALKEQRDANNLKNVVTSDAVGRLPDFSVGEALSRISGVSVQKDRGEPEFITIRGAAPRLNAVALNGDRLPSVADPTEDRYDRSVTLNAVPTGLISAIEVNKSVTLDMDADAVGGSVNLTTRSPLDLDHRILDAKVEWGRNELNDGDIYSFNVTYGQRLGAKKNLGLLLGASYQENDRAIDETNINYGDVTYFGTTTTNRTIQDIEVRHRFLERERKGVNAQLDWEPSAGNRLYVRGFFNQFRDNEQRLRLRHRFNSDGRYLAGSGINPDLGVVDGYRTVRQDRDGYKDTQSEQWGFGGRHERGDTLVDYSLSYAKSRFEVTRDVINWENRLTDTPSLRDGIADARFDATNFEFPSITFLTAGPADLSRFQLRNGRGDFTDQDDRSKESDVNGGLNYTRKATWGERPVTFKAGYRARFKETQTTPGARRFTRNTTASTLTLNNFLNADAPITIFDGRYTAGSTTNFGAIRNEFYGSPGNWTFDTAGDLLNNRLNSFTGEEDIHAGYAMATADFGALRLIGGVRYERTENSYTAFRRRTGDFALVVDQVSGSSTDDMFFPGLLAVCRFNDNLLLRAAWTNTLARPDYKDLSPFTDADIQFDDPTRTDVTLRVGNPALKPFESSNWDVSLEWYYARASYFSAGVFYKDITNFEFDGFTDVTTTTPPPETGAIPGAAANYRIRRTQPVNGPDASLQGFEFAWSHKFDRLPAPFNGLGFIANATFIEGESTLPAGNARSSLDLLPAQVDEVYNFQLYWENHRFAVRAAWNYNGPYLEEVGADALRDNYVDSSETLDLSFEWKVWKGHKLYVEVKNATDEYIERKYQGFANKPILREETGRVLLMGAKLEF
jgi:TonB-dependent receptor